MGVMDLITARRMEKAQVALAALAAFFYTGGSIPFNRAAQLDGGDWLFTLMSTTMLIGGVIFAMWHWRACLRLAPRIWPVGLLLILVFASPSWSQAPMISLRRAVSLLALVLFTLSAYAGLGTIRLMHIVLRTMLVTAVVSLILAVLRPSIGLDVGDYANAIRGIYVQKNVFGMALLDGVLALSMIVLDRGRICLPDIAVTGFMLVMLVLSRSTTSLLLSLVSIGATVAVLMLRRQGILRAVAVVGILTGVVALVLFVQVAGSAGLFDLIGKDSTLTGRIEIWQSVWQAINRRALLGYGYNAFWIADSPAKLRIWADVGWEPPTAHNGYLDAMLQLGYFGVAIAIFLQVYGVLVAVIGLLGRQKMRAVWLLLFVTVQTILARTESGLLSADQHMVFWLLGTLAVRARAVQYVEPPIKRLAARRLWPATRTGGAIPPSVVQSRNN